MLGIVKLQVWRGSFTCLLLCRLVESKRCCPILGKSASKGMGVEIKDSDTIRWPDTSGGHVFSVKDVMSSSKPLTKVQVIEMFPDVFNEGLGLLDGKYHICLNDSAKPVQHAPWQVQVALCSKIKDTLEELHSAEFIEPVSKPTPWISSTCMLAVPKKNGKIRICPNPKDLNKAILWENYPMPTIEDIATRLHGTKVFSTLNAKNGFWHVKLDGESSLPFTCPLAAIVRVGQYSPQVPAASVFANYSCIKHQLLLVDKSNEKLCLSFTNFVISAYYLKYQKLYVFMLFLKETINNSLI